MTADTGQLILDKAETLMRSRGYTAFSYADLAADLGITKASVHYHFASKEALVLAILARCLDRGRATLVQLTRDHADVRDKLRAYAATFLFSVESGMMPVCGTLSAERGVLPESTYPSIQQFFQMQIDWLADVVREGTAAGILAPPLPPEQAAVVIFSALEGGTMIAWGMDRKSVVLTAFEAILDCMMMQTQMTRQPTSAAVGKRQQKSQTGPRTRKRKGAPSRRSAAQAGGPLK
ncbi:TetR/AcrR family transcriptional regulator [Ferrovibrio terrae]|uniref:TetR/AcrR family transcriptional regulator n=1 Tax=Ferrovibrio terrae TaxID=2594003 RepID=A0A516H538_9PROT|nr:TetR/AcrR family transcriptional regulator [Ferrovibrio terrae]QDO98852.1 TetR/AcrR family transcriptional regulator [Ferrovibrio terrae]